MPRLLHAEQQSLVVCIYIQLMYLQKASTLVQRITTERGSCSIPIILCMPSAFCCATAKTARHRVNGDGHDTWSFSRSYAGRRVVIPLQPHRVFRNMRLWRSSLHTIGVDVFVISQASRDFRCRQTFDLPPSKIIYGSYVVPNGDSPTVLPLSSAPK